MKLLIDVIVKASKYQKLLHRYDYRDQSMIVVLFEGKKKTSLSHFIWL